MKIKLKKAQLTAQDLRLKATGAYYYEVLNHYSFSKYTAVYFNYDGEIINHLHSNSIADLKETLKKWFGIDRERFLIHVYNKDSKLTHCSKQGFKQLTKV